MRNLIALLLVWMFFALIHEGAHAATAMALDEYAGFHVRGFGLEVTFKTSLDERSGFKWTLISGTSNLITIALGYGCYAIRRRFISSRHLIVVALGYWLCILFLTLDPLNLIIGPFIYGGDAMGIAAGLNVSPQLIQGASLLIFLINREIVAHRVLPDFGISTRHPLFRPWLPVRTSTSPKKQG
jgi:hypothetical protein